MGAPVSLPLAPPPKAPFEKMAWIPGGTFMMGSDKHYPEEAPPHKVSVGAFWMDQYAVTNADFRRFVEATSHVTLVERPADPALYPGAKPELLVPASIVFYKPPQHSVDLRIILTGGYMFPARLRHPFGPDSTLDGRWDHPVIQVAFEDAQAYAAWAGKELPAEAEWEFAAHGGLADAEYAWVKSSRLAANTWPTPGRANSPSITRSKTVLNSPRPSDLFHPTAMVYLKWPATLGSGPSIGISTTARSKARAALLRIPAAA